MNLLQLDYEYFGPMCAPWVEAHLWKLEEKKLIQKLKSPVKYISRFLFIGIFN